MLVRRVGRAVVVAALATGLALALAVAVAGGGQTTEGTPLPDTRSRDGGAPSADSGRSTDATADAPGAEAAACAPRAADAGCPFTASPDPFYDAGSSSCWARLGGAEVTSAPDDACTSQAYAGGSIPPGAYDAVRVEHPTSGLLWRGSLVLMPNATFTEITSVADGGGRPTYDARQGTWTTKDAALTLAASCSMGQASPNEVLPYAVTRDACGRVFLIVGSGEARVTYAQR